MEQKELKLFANNLECYVELVLDDGRIVIGKEFNEFILDIDGNLNAWQIKPDNKVLALIDGLEIKEIRKV